MCCDSILILEVLSSGGSILFIKIVIIKILVLREFALRFDREYAEYADIVVRYLPLHQKEI